MLYFFQDSSKNWYRLDTATGIIEDRYGEDTRSHIDVKRDENPYYYEYIQHYDIIPKELRARLIATIERFKTYNIIIDNIYCYGHVAGCLLALESLSLIPTTVNNLDEDKVARLVSKYRLMPLVYVRACINAGKSPNYPDITAFQGLLEREGILEIEEIREKLLPIYYELKVARGEPLAAVRNVWHDLTKTMRKADWYYEGAYREKQK